MIDLHTHLLPGIDDGAQDLYDTIEMVRMAAESGITAMVATPHCNIPDVYENYFDDTYVELVERVRRAVREEELPVQIFPGMEAFATPELPELIRDGRIMTLNQSHYLLVEFAFDESPDFMVDILDEIRSTDVIPVIAHAERYDFVQAYPPIAYEWRQKGYLIQVNKGSFQGRFGRRARKAAFQLMDQRLVSAVASDAHSYHHRTPYMTDVYEELLEDYPASYLRALFLENPLRILQDQPMEGYLEGRSEWRDWDV